MNWADIPNFPKYEVSDTGLIRNKKNKKILAMSKSKKFTTYLRVTLFKDGVRYYKQLHRLVAEAFISNPENKPQVDHIDGNGENNHVNNLQWVSPSENIRKSFTANRKIKLDICSNGGKKAGKTLQQKAEKRYRDMLEHKFIAFYKGGILNKDACVSYKCDCGEERTVTIMAKELRAHKGKCPKCTNTTKRSCESLL